MGRHISEYIRFSSVQGETIVVEVDDISALSPEPRPASSAEEEHEGTAKAGLSDAIAKSVARGQALLETAIHAAIKANVECFYAAIVALENIPTEVEITFGIKATGELNTVAISKASGEANYSVKLAWKPFVKKQSG